jgi:AcrR family transcriptional regulator
MSENRSVFDYTQTQRHGKPIGTIGAMNDADARIADQAAELFHQHGITATGVEALSRAAGISKRTLYERFGSKDGLIAAAFEVRDAPVFCGYTEPAERATTPAAQLKRLFAELEAVIRSPGFRGCPFTSAATELPAGHPAQPVIRRHKERLRRWMLVRAKAAGARDPAQLSRRLMVLFDGALIQSVVQSSARPARDAREVAETLIDDAVGERSSST